MDPLNITAQIEGIEFLIVILIIAVLLILAPKYIAPLFRSAGRAKGEFTRGKLEVERELETEFGTSKGGAKGGGEK